MKILVVDDDLELLGLVGFALRAEEYAVVEATDGAEALLLFQREQPDLVILDINLPGLNGFEVCRQMRAEATTPILMLTARSTEDDHVHGLDQGADDYLTKPFSPQTLLAHVRALLRRSGMDRPAPLVAGDLRLSLEDRTISVCGGEPIHLTKREFSLLQYLIANPERTLSTERLTSQVWGYTGTDDRQLLKQIVHRIRQKIELDPADPRYLVTVSGVGYLLRPTPKATS
jgi:DNA-binding response OmpR family regulator